MSALGLKSSVTYYQMITITFLEHFTQFLGKKLQCYMKTKHKKIGKPIFKILQPCIFMPVPMLITIKLFILMIVPILMDQPICTLEESIALFLFIVVKLFEMLNINYYSSKCKSLILIGNLAFIVPIHNGLKVVKSLG